MISCLNISVNWAIACRSIFFSIESACFVSFACDCDRWCVICLLCMPCISPYKDILADHLSVQIITLQSTGWAFGVSLLWRIAVDICSLKKFFKPLERNSLLQSKDAGMLRAVSSKRGAFSLCLHDSTTHDDLSLFVFLTGILLPGYIHCANLPLAVYFFAAWNICLCRMSNTVAQAMLKADHSELEEHRAKENALKHSMAAILARLDWPHLSCTVDALPT